MIVLAGARHAVFEESAHSEDLSGVCDAVGIPLDKWQRDIFRVMGQLNDGDDSYTHETVAFSIARQAGKTHLIRGYAFSQCLAHPNTTVAWTAHATKVANESFQSLMSICDEPDIKPHIRKVIRTAGQEAIIFKNKSRIITAARERGGIRGFAKVRILVLDEAQILTETAMSDMVPTMNQATNPQIIMLGTPPKPKDASEVFTYTRRECLEAFESGETGTGQAYIEFSADGDADSDDPKQWAKANPSYPKHTKTPAILRMRKNMTEDNFRREAMGIWDDQTAPEVISEDVWRAAEDEGSVITGKVTLCIDVAPDGESASVVLAGESSEGGWHVELVENRRGFAWTAKYVADIVRANPQVRSVIVDAGGPARAVIEDLARLKVKVDSPNVRDVGAACEKFVSDVRTGELKHIGQIQMWAALKVVRKRQVGGYDMWAWNRLNDSADITPISAASLALWGAQRKKARNPGTAGRKGGRGGSSGRRGYVG